MKRSPSTVTLLLAAAMSIAALPVAADDRYGTQKAVYDVNYEGGDSGKDYLKVLRNVQNHVNAVGKDNIEVKVMLSGDGLGMLRDANSNDKLKTAITQLKSQKVGFLICNNTLVGRKIDPATLFEVFNEDIVPSGNAEMAHLQSKGYAYLKP